jgi:outer membrane lipoprotein-sorting protein
MRCSAFAVALLWCPVSTVQAQDGAQKLYEAMAQKLDKAKAYKFSFIMDAKESERPIKVSGTVVAAAANRLKLTVEGQDGKRQLKGVVVGDGKTLALQFEVDGQVQLKTRPVHDKFLGTFTGYISRAGMFAAVEGGLRAQDGDPASELQLSGFKLVGKEKVAGRECNVVQDQIARGDAKVSGTGKLWLDTKTNLPLKRTLELNREGKVELRATETYNNWELDSQLPERTFTLPK